jgi:hypothetical protein
MIFDASKRSLGNGRICYGGGAEFACPFDGEDAMKRSPELVGGDFFSTPRNLEHGME